MGIDVSARARALGVTTESRSFGSSRLLSLPQRIAVIAQGASASTYSSDKFTATSANMVGSEVGYGSPAHLIVSQLLPRNGDGVGPIPVDVFPLADSVSGVAAAGSITPTVGQTENAEYYVTVNNIRTAPIVLGSADTVATACTAITAAINAVPSMPVIATDSTTTVDLVAKWEGTSGNDIVVEVSEGNGESTFAITQPTGGLADPDLSTALAALGPTWYTMVITNLPTSDSTALGAVKDAGEERWGALVRMPFVCFWGDVQNTVALATTVPDARKTDRINAQLVNPGSNDLPFVVAARQLARIAKQANNNPPTDYGSLIATGLVPSDSVVWSYTERDQAVKAGSSTITVRDGEVSIGDVVTFYHPSGEEDPAYRYVVDIVKLQNILYNVSAIFEDKPWDGAPLLPDDQPTTNPNARRPKDAIAALYTLTDQLANAAIISDPAYSKANMTASINATNAKRIDIVYPVKLSGNANVIDVSLYFSFYYGGVAA